MTFANPAMLWGLFALVLLVILSFWRLRPQRVTVASVFLWKRIPERPAPLKHAHSPKASLELLLQMLAVSALVLGMSDPSIFTKGKPRAKAHVYVDGAPGMAERARAKRASDVLRRFDGVAVERHATLEAAREAFLRETAEAKWAAFITDAPRVRAEPGELWFIVGDACPNRGIIDVAVEGKRVTATIFSNVDATVAVTCGDQRQEVRVADEAACVTFDVGASIAVEAGDTFPDDDVVRLKRVEARGEVGISETNEHLINAIKAMGLKPVVGGGDVVFVTAGASWTPGELKVAEHEITRDVVVGPVPEAREVSGEALIVADGKTVVAMDGGKVVCGLTLGRVGRGPSWVDQPSFPIFWAQAIRHARRGHIEEGRWVAEGLLDREASDLAQGPPSEPAQFKLDTSARKRKLDLQAPLLVVAGLFIAAAWAAAAWSRP